MKSSFAYSLASVVVFAVVSSSSPWRLPMGKAAFTSTIQTSRLWITRHNYHSTSSTLLLAKPKKGIVVDSYQTVSVNCAKCGERLFRYKKKNGTKSNLVKCYVERIVEDSAGLLAKQQQEVSSSLSAAVVDDDNSFQWECPSCQTQFARSSLIHGRPALKLVGGKVRMTKK